LVVVIIFCERDSAPGKERKGDGALIIGKAGNVRRMNYESGEITQQ
jgi:hypothetical protein